MELEKIQPTWESALLPLGSTIQQAIQSLEDSRKQIVLIIAEGNKLVGTLTDGDIRRAFIKGLGLKSLVDQAANFKPLIVPPEISCEHVLQIMQINKVHQLPIVDDSGVVIGLHVWDSMIAPSVVDNIMVIMAGGRGFRLRPYTDCCPKPMLEVNGKPILQHIIERAAINGFRNFVISLHYLGEVIVEHFGDGSKFGVQISYLREDIPLGTAGCLSLLSKKNDQPFIITNGDVLTEINYKEILDYHIKYDAQATMAVRQYQIQNQYGVVQINGIEIDGFEEKPIYSSYVNAGIYVLNTSVCQYLEHNQYCDMPMLFERIKQDLGRTIVYPMHESWIDLGRHEDLAIARKLYDLQEKS